MSEGVILPRVSEGRFNPLGFDQPGALKPAEQRIDCAFLDNEAGLLLEPVEEFESIQPARPQTGERRQLDATFPELDFPAGGGIGPHKDDVRAGVAYSQGCSA